MRYQELLYKWLFIWLIFVRFKEQHHEEFLNQLVCEKSVLWFFEEQKTRRRKFERKEEKEGRISFLKYKIFLFFLHSFF